MFFRSWRSFLLHSSLHSSTPNNCWLPPKSRHTFMIYLSYEQVRSTNFIERISTKNRQKYPHHRKGRQTPTPRGKNSRKKTIAEKKKLPISKRYTFPWTREEHHQIHGRNINNRRSLQKHPHHRKGRQTPTPRGRRLVAGKTNSRKAIAEKKKPPYLKLYPFPWTGEEHHQIHERNINNRKSLQKHPHHRKGRQTPTPRGEDL